MKIKKLLLFILGVYLTTTNLYSQLPNNIPPNNLVGYWALNANANDSSINNLNGVVNGATLTNDRNGNSNSAYSFSSISENISVPNNSLISLSNTDFTINAWIKLDNFPSLGSASEVYNQYYTILGKRQYGTSENNYSIGISTPNSPNGAGNLVFAQGPAGRGNFISSNSPINTGVWNNVSIVYTVYNQTIKFYVNNNLVAEQTGVTIPGQNSADFWIGNDVSGSATYFPGIIDDLGIWDRELSTAELNSIYPPCTETIVTPTITASGPTVLSQGESVVLTSSYPTGNLWCNGETTQSITVSETGNYKVSVSIGNCTSVSQPINVLLNTINNLPLIQDFEVSSTYNSVVGFEGATASIVPYINNCSANGNVLVGIQNVNGNPWQGIEFILTTKKAKLTTNKIMKVDVYCLQAINILGKVEPGTLGSGPISANGQAYTTPGQWQTLTFDFAVPMDNTTVANGEYQKIIFFGNWNSSNTGFNNSPVALTYQIDNIRVEHDCSNTDSFPPPVISSSGPTVLCPGESVVLTSSYSSGNTWSNGATTQSITVTESGSYSVSVSNGTCSTTSQPVVVTVTQVPTSVTIVPSGPTIICEGDSVTLSLNSLSSVRYLKFESYFSSDNGQVNVHEIQAFSNGTNVAFNKPGFANSYEYGGWINNGKNAVDSNFGSRWSSNRNDPGPDANNPHYIVIDLEAQYNLESILLNISSFQQTFSFKVSQDNINWIEAGSGTSVSGSFTFTPPVTNFTSYLWNNGATTPSITVSEGGSYSVTATIGTTCSITSNSINVLVNPIPVTPTISVSGSTTICQGESVILTSSYPTGNVWSNGETTQSITVTQSGSYTVINGGCSAPSAPIVVTVASQPSALLAPNNIVITTSPNQCVASNVNLGSPTGQSCTNFNITNNAPSEFPIGLTLVTWSLVNENGTTITANQNVTVQFTYQPASLCYVTSDENQPERNRIFINNANNVNVLEYQILREVSLNQYNVIGNIPANQNSFLDVISNNLSLSRKYRVNTISICNSNSIDTNTHATILLQSSLAVNGSVNLSWNPYLGLSYSSYNIYRKTGNGSFELIETIPSSNDSYNDVTANVSTNTYQYYIGIEVPGCSTSTQGRNFTFSTNQIKSNILSTGSTLGVSNPVLNSGVIIYPNPTLNILNIKTEGNLSYIKAEIYNIIGQKVSESLKTILDVSDLPNASYFVKIITEEGTVTKIFIKT